MHRAVCHSWVLHADREIIDTDLAQRKVEALPFLAMDAQGTDIQVAPYYLVRCLPRGVADGRQDAGIEPVLPLQALCSAGRLRGCELAHHQSGKQEAGPKFHHGERDFWQFLRCCKRSERVPAFQVPTVAPIALRHGGGHRS